MKRISKLPMPVEIPLDYQVKPWIADVAYKVNELVDTVNTLTEAPKPPQEESKPLDIDKFLDGAEKVAEIRNRPHKKCGWCDSDEEEIDVKEWEVEIRANERKTILENITNWIYKEEYCSGCSSTRKFCQKWGMSPSALKTVDLITYLNSLK